MLRELFLKRFFLSRSSHWPIIRKEFLNIHPNCEVCFSTKGLEVHHIKPVHLYPELELDPENLITLCRPKRCHLLFGHLNNWKSFNPEVINDSNIWNTKIMLGKTRI